MKENWFEHIISKRLSNKREIVNLDELWMELEEKRKPKRKVGILLYLVPTVLVLIGLVAFFNNTNVVENTLGPTQVAQAKLNHDDVDISPLTKTSTIERAATLSKKITNHSSDESQVRKSNETKNNHEQEIVFPEEKLDKYIQVNNVKVIEPSSNLEVEASTTNVISKNEFEGQSKVENTLLNQFKSIKQDIDNSKIDEISHLPLLEASLISQGARENYILENPIIEFPIKNANRQKFSIGINMSYGIANSNLVAINQDSSDLVQKRNDFEKFQDQFELGLSIEWGLKKNLIFKSGLNYQQYTSQYKINTTEIESAVINDVVEISRNTDGTEDLIFGNVLQTTTQVFQTTNYIKYRSIRIPILIGYKKHFGDQWGISILGGTSLGYAHFDDSKLLSENPASLSFNTFESAKYNKGILVDANVEMLILKKVSDDVSVNFGLKYNFDISDRINQASNQSHKLSGLNFKFEVQKTF